MINAVLINDLDFPQIIVTMKPQILDKVTLCIKSSYMTNRHGKCSKLQVLLNHGIKLKNNLKIHY